jgi:hypothetical protein
MKVAVEGEERNCGKSKLLAWRQRDFADPNVAKRGRVAVILQAERKFFRMGLV